MLLKKSTARNLSVFMTDSADHISGKTGLTLTITASKDGAAFASITPTVTELANGWYTLALTTSHTDTLGDLALHITATGADPTDLVRQVVEDLPGAATYATTCADALLDRRMDLGADTSANTTTGRTVRSALRAIRNKFSISGTTLTVFKEDDATTSHTTTLSTDGTAVPVVGSDPA